MRKRTKYCDRACYVNDLSRVKKTGKEIKCGNCETTVYKSVGVINASKSGRLFCSKSCSVTFNNSHRMGDKNPNYKNGNTTYRKKALKNKPLICEVCGYDEYPEVLHVHHLDGSHLNNKLENLKIVCPTCHEVIHFLEKSGKFYNR